MVSIREGFAGFWREGPDAGVGGVAEGVKVFFLILLYCGTVCADEEFVVTVVAGYGGGVLRRVGNSVWR